ncbi:hypothetical protein Tco_0189937 [Tanacetum coccineum]
MESSNSNSKERELQLTQRLAKQRHSICMTWFEQLETHLHDLYLLNSPYAVDAFKPAFRSFFGEEHQTFKLKMFHNLDQLRATSGKRNLRVNAKTCLQALRTQFKEFLSSKRAVITYGRLQLQSQDVQINPVQAVDDSLNVSKSSWIELENHNALSKSVNETQLQQHESLVTESTTLEANLNSDVKALDAGSVITESSETKSDMHDTSNSSRTYITHVVDANIRPVNDQVPSAEVHLTVPHNVLATEQYQAKSPLLKAELVKSKEMIEKETYNELSRRFLLLEKHCISLEISMQQKEENFQSNKPCKNQDAPEFCEFFEINDLKAQLQAKTTLICNLKNQIKSVKEASNEAKVKHEIDVLETINIELESSVAKLLAENEKLNKENEHLKQTYKELYDSIKKTRIQTKDHNDSLIAQVNSKTVENADLKAQIQEKVFANVALKNELRKLKGNSVDTKFAKPSILGKPVLQPPRNQSVVRQPNAFTSERPRISRPRFASQVDEKNDLSKTVTPHYLPKVRESAAAKPHQVNAPNYSRNSHKESYGSNDMVHAYFLEDAKDNDTRQNNSQSYRYGLSTRAHALLKLVNSRAKVQSPKIRNNNPVEPKNHTHKPGRRNGIGQRFSLNKSSAVHEKPHTPRSYLRWKPTGSSTQVQEFKEFKSDEHASNDVWTKHFKPRSSSKDVWTKQFRPRSSS